MRYLVINFIRKSNGRIDEAVSVAKSLQPRDQEKANLILDFGTGEIVKSIIEGKQHDTTFALVREYYNKIYPNLIEQLEKEAPITFEQQTKLKKLKGKLNTRLK